MTTQAYCNPTEVKDYSMPIYNSYINCSAIFLNSSAELMPINIAPSLICAPEALPSMSSTELPKPVVP